MDRSLSTWKAHEATARTRKRCPVCAKMIASGERVVARDETSQATSGKSAWIGNRQSYTRGAWRNYHPACWTAFLDAIEAAEIRTATERDARLDELARAIAEIGTEGQ